jgi:ABC-type Mn2+/Zn2+ transport system ATPase subunit
MSDSISADDSVSQHVGMCAAITETALETRPVVRGEHLTLGYRHRVVVQDLSFEIHRKDILGIVGPNGCGKTTLLRTILGLIPPQRGRIHRDPTLIVSYVPQRDRLDTLLPITALEVVLMGCTARAGVLRRARAADREAARRALSRVGAESLGPQLFRNLSGGQQQRVLLARALAAEPGVLVLDEPTAGMDIAGEASILAFLQDLNRTRDVTILIVTHLLSLVLNFATSIMLMGAREILHGPVDDVLREDRLTALYRVPIHLGHVGGQRMLVVGREAPRV